MRELRMRGGQIFVLKHLVQIVLTAGIIVALATMLYSCDLGLQGEKTTIDAFMEYYDDPSQQEEQTVTLGPGEAIIAYGAQTFQYRSETVTNSEELRGAGYFRGLYGERPAQGVCGEDMTCICHCERVNATTMDLNDTEYLSSPSPIPGSGQPRSNVTVDNAKIQCLEPTCRNHPADIKPLQDSANIFGESYSEYNQNHYFASSFAIINDPDITKPAQRVNDTRYTFAGYTDESATNQQTVSITNTSTGARTICLDQSCRE
jgi:hypothetical protein